MARLGRARLLPSFCISEQRLGRSLALPRFSTRQLTLQIIQLLGDFPIALAVVVDGSDGVKDGRVIAAAEVAADFFEAIARVTARQIHADLAGEGNALVATFALKIRQANVVVLRYRIQDLLDGDPPLVG